MRSLRRSLILYFLGLSAVGLGSVAILADRVSSRALADKQQAAIEALHIRTDERLKQEQDRFQADLVADAKVVSITARTEYMAQAEMEFRRFQAAMIMPIVGFGGTPLATFTLTGLYRPVPQSPPPSALQALAWSYFNNLRLDELFLRGLDDHDKATDFVQINTTMGSVRRTANLGGYTMPFDRKPSETEDVVFDEIPLPDGLTGRRVVYRTSLPFLSTMFRGGPGGGRGRDRDRREMFIFVSLARSVETLTSKLSAIRAEARHDEDDLVRDTRQTIGWVRFALALTGGLTFLGLVAGGSVLIGWGMKPIHHLSDAVSRVTERDFRIPMDRDELPNELLPVHDRMTQTLDALKRAFEREKQSVADISHELRTPVASLLATLDASLRKPRSAEQYKTTLQECRGLTKQLGGLVERVMTLAYLDAGQAQLSRFPTDPIEVVHGCAAMIRPLAEAHGLTFTQSTAPVPEVMTDPDKLREVLINLLHNAIEYNRCGGSVELALSQPMPNRVAFTVRDTGIGMSAEVRERIFERFYRADASRTKTGVHAGLGLAIVKEYIDRLGGTITVSSALNVGSEFRVELPA